MNIFLLRIQIFFWVGVVGQGRGRGAGVSAFYFL